MNYINLSKPLFAGLVWGIISIFVKSQIDARVGTAQYPFVFYFWPVIVSSVFNGFLAGYTVLIIVSIYLVQSAVIISLIELNVNTIVRHYKGKIWAESKINHGTVFHVELRKIS